MRRNVSQGRAAALLRPENGTFDTPDYADVYARQKWFYQAQIESPAMFARAPGAGSLYWLCTRDGMGRLSRRRQVLHPGRAAAGAREAVLVDHRV